MNPAVSVKAAATCYIPKLFPTVEPEVSRGYEYYSVEKSNAASP